MSHNVWDPFKSPPTVFSEDLENILTEVTGIHNVCQATSNTLLGLNQVKLDSRLTILSNTEIGQRTDDEDWLRLLEAWRRNGGSSRKLLECKLKISTKIYFVQDVFQQELSMTDCPLKDSIFTVSQILHDLAPSQVIFESELHKSLGPSNAIHDMIKEEFPEMQVGQFHKKTRKLVWK